MSLSETPTLMFVTLMVLIVGGDVRPRLLCARRLGWVVGWRGRGGMTAGLRNAIIIRRTAAAWYQMG